jgi:hypothetical protein
MFWNKKDSKDSLPDLPPMKAPLRPAFDLPSHPDEHPAHEMDDDMPEKHGLPAFPDSPTQRGFSQTAIKEAITQDQIPEEEPEQHFPPAAAAIRTTELDSMSAMPAPRKFTLEEPPMPPAERTFTPPRRPAQKPNETFVKIERFNSAHKSLTSIRKKIDELDSSLRKIREVKLREEQELSSWEKEVASLKSRLQEVNDSLFE